MKKFSIFLIMAALIVGIVGCGDPIYTLTVKTTAGGAVAVDNNLIIRGTAIITYNVVVDTVVSLNATPDPSYRFVNWTGDVGTIADVSAATTNITVNADYSIRANFVRQCNLTISSTTGGSVTTPGMGDFTYDMGTVVNLVATPGAGYRFLNWTGDVGTIADVNAASTIITMNGDYSITANFVPGLPKIWDWYDLDAIRYNPSSSYILMRNLDSTTAGYTELASPTANGGKGWQPIEESFTGSFDGQGYEISNLFIDGTNEGYGIALFHSLSAGGVIENINLVNTDIVGYGYVGSLVGELNGGTMNNCYAAGNVTGTVTGSGSVGSLVGGCNGGTLNNCHATGTVTGPNASGGLVGYLNGATVNNCHATGTVTGGIFAGGLVGFLTGGTVSNCYATGNVMGTTVVGGLVGELTGGTVNNCYATGNVVSHGCDNGCVLYIGGLVGQCSGTVVSNSFWDIDTSGQSTSCGGTGETTAQMKSIATFSGATWNITAVANLGTRNPSYIWNIVNGVTYPFLSSQP